MLGLALLATGCSSTGSQWRQNSEAVNLRRISTTEEEQSLKPGDSAVVACTSCKSVVYLNLARPGQALLNPLGKNHPCPECKAHLKRVRVGKTHQIKIIHLCEKCGKGSVFCCATRQGNEPITGIGEK